jgi:hypothetical protein
MGKLVKLSGQKKIGRNDPCWCNSGQKYKKCHLYRDKQPAATPWEVDAMLRAERRSGKCLFVDANADGGICGKPAISSHSVSRKMLKQIAWKGHVYNHSATLQDIGKAGGRPLFKLIGVNDASALRLFCAEHDSEEFAPLEKADFSGSPEQCCLLAYRAACNEYLKKRNQRDGLTVQKTLDRGKSVDEQIEIQKVMAVYSVAVEAGFLDMERQKQEFDKVLVAKQFDRLKAYVVTFDSVPQILAAGVLSPECDFEGHTLQNLGALGARLDVITHSLITTNTGGAFVFAWLDVSDGASRKLAQSLDRIPDDEVANAVVRFVFEFCENHYVNPAWWDGLDNTLQKALLERLAVSADPTKPRVHAACLRDDGFSPVKWKVTGRYWV